MKFPIKLLEKKEKTEYYLALILQNEKANSIIFEKLGDTIKYISSDEEYFKDTIENATTDEFLDTLDKVITTAETSLPDNIETHKTIFGLKDNWIEDDKIKKEYLEKLKKATDELSLEPIGFLAFSESLINLLLKEEGVPVTAILVNVGKKYLTIHWIRGGKILESKTSEIHDSASFTADALMKHFQTGGNLPAKIVIFNSDEDELTQEFISHQWSKSLPFLHIPQIISLPEDVATKAMLLGAATQMNTELIYDYSKNFDTTSQQTNPQTDKSLHEETQESEENLLENSEQDIINESTSQEVSSDFFGFVQGTDVTKTIPQFKEEPNIEVPTQLQKESIEEIPQEVKYEEEIKNPMAINFALVSEKIKLFLPKLLKGLNKVKLNGGLKNKLTSKNKLFLIIPIFLILLLFGLFYTYLFKTTAQVNIFVDPKQDQKETDITFSQTTNVNDKTLSYETVTVTQDGTVSTNTTGKKYIGDKAKGTVTIFNNSNSSISLSGGTQITSSNNLNYTLDKSISVASASGDIFTGTKPGTTDVSVTASDIGQDYNLPSGTKFTVGSNSNIAAKNDNAFSGGTKKAITVVSSDDINKLLADLPKNLEQKARDDLKTKTTDGKTIIQQFISTNIDNKSFNKKEGDEASSLTLNGSVSYDAISYLNKDMDDLASSLFPTDEKIMPNNLEVNAQNIKKQKNNDITANLTINAKLMPKIDVESLRRQIAGNSKQKATNLLSNLSQVKEVTIDFNPNIPLLPKNLPGDYKKIFINITTK